MAATTLSRAEIENLPSMWKSPGYIPTLIAVACAFGAWSLLLPVIPLAVLSSGGTDSLAGATTGIFMAATVITQIFTPMLLRRFGYLPVMMISALLLGVPALGYLIGVSALPVLAFSAIRGVGFGALTVAQSALVAEMVPVRYLGKASGMLGVFVGGAQMLFLPLGPIITESFGGQTGYHVVYILAAIIALIAGVMCVKIPNFGGRNDANNTSDANSETGSFTSELAAPPVSTWKLVTVPAIAINTIAMSFGALSTFLPAAVGEISPANGAIFGAVLLSVAGGAAMVFRFIAGLIADRVGLPGSTMIPGQIIAGIGVAATAVILFTELPVWWLLLTVLLFGSGFGMVQNEALLSMFARLPRSRVSDASAIWNIAYDAGTGIGSFVLGIVAGQLAYSGAYGVATVIIALGLTVTVADRVAGRHRIAEYSNTRAQLRQIPVARKAVRGARKVRRAASPVGVSRRLRRRSGPTANTNLGLEEAVSTEAQGHDDQHDQVDYEHSAESSESVHEADAHQSRLESLPDHRGDSSSAADWPKK